MSEPNDLWRGLWTRLQDGLAHADAPGRTLSLATQRVGGGASVRMLVLRDLDQNAQSLTFYTHAGSQKVADLTEEPRAELLLWDPATSFQARLTVTVTMAQGSVALWESQSPGARLNYVPTLTPGAPINAPHVPTAAGSEAFVILIAKIASADILDLSELPHKRTTFNASDDFTGQWVAP